MTTEGGAAAMDDPGRVNRPPRASSWTAGFTRGGLLAAAILGLYVGLHTVDSLSKGFVTTPETWSFDQLQSPLVWRHLEAWQADLSTDPLQNQLENWQDLLRVFVALDVLFVAAYGWALWRSRARLVSRWFTRALVALVVADLLENVVVLVAGSVRDGTGTPDVLVYVAAVLTTVKWLLAAATAVLWFRFAPWRPMGRVVRALWIQRFSLLAFLPVALLSVVPGPSVFDQLPDLQRRWLDGSTPVELTKPALVHVLLLLPAVFVLGRVRSDWAARKAADPGWPTPREGRARVWDRAMWGFGPVVLLVLALAGSITGRADIHWERFIAFSAVPVIVLLVSEWLRIRKQPHLGTKPLRRPLTPEHVVTITAVGDVLTVASLSLAGLGLVRSMTGLVVLDGAGLLETPASARASVLLAVGVVGALLPWVVAAPVSKLIDALPDRPGGAGWLGRVLAPGEDAGASVRVGVTVRLALLLLATAGFLGIALFTVPLARGLGALAVTLAALSSAVVLLGVTVAYAQERPPPELFQVRCPRLGLPLRATPILPLFVIAIACADIVGGPADVHGVRGVTTPAEEIADRPDLAGAFEDWEEQDDAVCRSSVTLAGGRRHEVRPMLLVAAEGGGIRATYWTVGALEVLAGAGDGCGTRATLLSSGASGGALGLTVARFDTTPLAGVRAVSGDDALAVATAGMITRDVLASATGIAVRETTPFRDEEPVWLDRAGLMELVWQSADEVDERLIGADPGFVQPRGQLVRDGAVTGHLVLNATAARTMCRALMSQLDLTGSGEDSRGFPSCGTGGAGPNSLDLLGSYAKCHSGPWAAAAGLVASRFPYVTPSGVFGPCGKTASMQAIDGGYMENDGLGTIADLAESWGPLVAQHNRDVLRGVSRDPLVVPILVYLDNGTGTDYPDRGEGAEGGPPVADLPWPWLTETVPEAVVPIWGLASRFGRTTETWARLEVGDRLVRGSWCTDATLCDDAVEAVEAWSRRRTFVVHQAEQPSLTAPLGWVLSETSQDDLDADLCLQATTTSPGYPLPKRPFPEYGSLGDLLVLLGGAPALPTCD